VVAASSAVGARAVWGMDVGADVDRAGGPATITDGDNGTGRGVASGLGGARVDGGRRCSGPTGDDDEGEEGGSVRAVTLGLEAAAARNKKPNQSECELCGAWGERSSVLVQNF
jgi:hypothetical protein